MAEFLKVQDVEKSYGQGDAALKVLLRHQLVC